jgi:CubicO group peptidase (beta-lactamase class C family)
MTKKLTATLAAVAVLVAGWLVRPAPPQLDDEVTGDTALADRVRAANDGRGHRLAVALVDLGDQAKPVRYAGFAADQDARFETGSVSKGLTGLLLADAVRRGEVRLDQQVGDVLPDVRGTDVGSVTLEDLATHHSGLPRLPTGPLLIARSAVALARGGNLYPFGRDDLIEQARSAGTDDRGEAVYSNLGAAVLGHALAARAGTSYPQLRTERVLAPLGMTSTTVAVDDGTAAPPGLASSGREQDPWIGQGYGPAGGVVSTTGDLARLVTALLNGTGAEALKPRRDFDENERIGLHWFTSPLPGTDRTMVWHNGGTGGYSAFVGLDPAKRRGIVVLSDTATAVDDLGTELLEAS